MRGSQYVLAVAGGHYQRVYSQALVVTARKKFETDSAGSVTAWPSPQRHL